MALTRILSLTLVGLVSSLTLMARAEDAAPKKPALPQIVRLSVQPATLTLDDSRDARALIVRGTTATGVTVDLSPVATILR